MLPDFLIIGAQKAGTTWLHAALSQHPEIFLPEGEIHFFDKAFHWERGVDWYEAHFAGAEGFRAVGEKTPDYLWANGVGVEGHLPDVHRHAHRVLPEARLVVSLRDPVARAVSAVLHLLRTRRVSPLHSLDELLVGESRELVRGHGVIEYGFYHRQLEAWLELYDRERLFVVILEEDVARAPHATLRELCAFLGVDPGYAFALPEDGVNVARRSWAGLVADYYAPSLAPLTRLADRALPAHRPRPRPETLRALRDLYAEENEKLFALLGRRVEAWGKAAGTD